jgi:hypothetical protein
MGSPSVFRVFEAGAMRTSSRSRGRAIDFASMPISCRKTSGRKVSSNRRRPRQLSKVVAGRPKTELSINATADHLALEVSEARRLKSLEDENTRLKRLLADAGQCCAEGTAWKKMVTPATHRETVAHLRTAYEMSEHL